MVRSGAPRTALLVLYGSETGNAHDVAERIAREATRRSYAATVRAMDAYDVTALPSAGRAVFVTSTMGQGDPPANVRAFWRFLLRKNLPANSLAGLAFACFGLGDSHYRQYNVVAKRLHKRLLGLGARSVADLGLGDDQHPSGYDAALDPWLETLWERMRDDVVTRDAPSAPPSARADPDADPEDERKFDAEILQRPPREEEGGESSAADSSSAVAASAMLDAALGLDRVERLAERGAHARDGSNPEPSRRYAPATALRNDALTAPDAVTETRHVELALVKQKCPQGVIEPSSSRLSSSASDPDFNDSYAPGDCLAVLPLPDPGDVAPGASSARARAVAEVLRRAGVAPDALVAVSPRRRGDDDDLRSSSSDDGFSESAVRSRSFTASAVAIVAGCLDVSSATPRRYFFEVASRFARSAAERDRLAHFASPAGRDDLYAYAARERRTVGEFLDDFPSVHVPFAWMLQIAPRLRERLFSLSSSARIDGPNAAHLTVSVARWTTRYGRRREGLCSGAFTEATFPVGATLAAARLVRHADGAHWRPEPGVPIVCVCAGSGVAPVRALVRERVARRRRLVSSGGGGGVGWEENPAGETRVAPTLVFFGCRHSERDFLYRDEWEGDETVATLEGTLESREAGEAGEAAAAAAGGSDSSSGSGSGSGLRGGFVAAFSRDEPGAYVQDRIRAHAGRVWAFLSSGASVFVAGSSGTKMPEDVRDAFVDAMRTAGGISDEEAKAALRRMDARGKYVVEAW